MKSLFIALRIPVAIALACGALSAQQGASPKHPAAPVDYSYKAAEAKDLRIAQLEFQAAQRDINLALRDWSEACESLRQAKAWPEGTSCNIQTGEIVPAPAPPPDEKKTGDKKK